MSLFDSPLEQDAAQAVMIGTVAIWGINTVCLMAGLNKAKHSPSDQKGLIATVLNATDVKGTDESATSLVSSTDDGTGAGSGTSKKWNRLQYFERINGNNLEQFPLSLAIFWATLLVSAGAPKDTPGVESALSVVGKGIYAYIGVRLAYVGAYLLDLSPWRSIVWAVGQGVCVYVASKGISVANGWSK